MVHTCHATASPLAFLILLDPRADAFLTQGNLTHPRRSHEPKRLRCKAHALSLATPQRTRPRSHMSSDRVLGLLEWCAAHGLRIDPRLRVLEDEWAGLRVIAADALPFPHTCEPRRAPTPRPPIGLR